MSTQVLTNEQVARIHRLVSQFVDSQRSFTAYDITVLLRSDGEYFLHTPVKVAVHQMFFDNEMPYFERTLRPDLAPAGKEAPWVYHHFQADPQSYVSHIAQTQGKQFVTPGNMTAPTPTTTPSLPATPGMVSGSYSGPASGLGAAVGAIVAAATPTVPAVPSSVGKASSRHRQVIAPGRQRVDLQKRIRVHKNTLEQAGFQAGDFLFVLIDPKENNIIISDKAPRTDGAKLYRVDEHCNMRISLARLNKTDYQVMAVPNKVVIQGV